jgi:hypothetical protein
MSLLPKSHKIDEPGACAIEYLAEYEQVKALYENVFDPASFLSPRPYIPVA